MEKLLKGVIPLTIGVAAMFFDPLVPFALGWLTGVGIGHISFE